MKKSGVEMKLREKELQNKLKNNETFTYEEGLELRNFIEVWIRNNLINLNNFMFKITDDFKINGDGNVIISAQTDELPYKFGIINGDFNMATFHFTSLENTPDEVGGNFFCSGLQLLNLKGGPKKVKNYIAANCSINTLIGFNTEVTDSLLLTNNDLTSLEGCPFCPTILINSNKLTSLKHLPDGTYKTLEFQNNLISEIPENNITAISILLDNNRLTSFKNIPKVTDTLSISGNKIKNFSELSSAYESIANWSLRGDNNEVLELPKIICDNNPLETLENFPFCSNLYKILIFDYPHLDWLPIKERLLSYNLFLDKYYHDESAETLTYPNNEGKIGEENLKMLLPFPIQLEYINFIHLDEFANLKKLCRILLTSFHYPDWDFTSFFKPNFFDFLYNEKSKELIKFKQAAMKIIEEKGMF